jgi:hypothetical protein
MKPEPKKKTTTEERLKILRQRRAALDADIAKIETKAKDQERKIDTRRKIIIGAGVMAHAALQQDFAYRLKQALNSAITKEADRELIKDFLP